MTFNFNPRHFAATAEADEVTNPFPTILGAQEIKHLIQEFNPSKNTDIYAKEWIKAIEQLGRAYNWTSYHLLLYATMRLTGIARIWYEYSLEHITDWEDFKCELVKNFPRRANPAEIHAKLVAKKRKPSESAVEYVHTTVKLAKKAHMDDAATVEYLINGLNNVKHQMILAEMDLGSPCELLQHLEHLEDCDQFEVEASQKKKKTKLCWKCSSEGHTAATCPKRSKNAGLGNAVVKPNSKVAFKTEESQDNPKISDLDLYNTANLPSVLQTEDEKISRIRKGIEVALAKNMKPSGTKNMYQLVDQALYRITNDGLRYCVPFENVKSIISFTHITAGHAAFEDLMFQLQRVYHIPKKLQFVRRCLSSCAQCAVQRLIDCGDDHFIFTREESAVPFYILYAGFLGPFTKSNQSNYEYVFVVIDAHSQFVKLQAVVAPGREIVEKTVSWIAQHLPCPALIVSRQEEPFTCADFQDYCRVNGLKQGFFVEDNDQGVKRSNLVLFTKLKSINIAVKKLFDIDDDGDWDEKLSNVQKDLNTLKDCKESQDPREKILQYRARDTLEEILYKMVYEKIYGNAYEELESDQDDLRDSEDTEEVEEQGAKYKKDDLVLIHHEELEGKKAVQGFHGPYAVRKILKNKKYLITDTLATQKTKKKRKMICSEERMRRWLTEEDLDKYANIRIE